MRRRRGAPHTTGDTLDGQPVGAALRLVGVDGDPDRTRRLMDLGLRAGDTVVVTHVRGRGVVLACESGRIAIGPEVARHIRVEEVP